MARRFEEVMKTALRLSQGWASSTPSGLGYPWAGCVPAEPASVSPGDHDGLLAAGELVGGSDVAQDTVQPRCVVIVDPRSDDVIQVPFAKKNESEQALVFYALHKSFDPAVEIR